jgi:ABC-type amino acid transport substrate-binding protein
VNARTLISLLVLAVLVVAGIIYFNKGGEDAQQAATPPAATTEQTTAPATTADSTAASSGTAATTDQTQTAAVAPLTALAGKTVKVATEGAYPPFNFVDANGALQGFDVDIANALCAKMQVTCEIVKQDWDGMIPGLLAKKYDVIIASMSITPERKEKINFTGKYYNTPAVIVAPANTTITLSADGNPDPASMKGLKIGVQRATIHENFARDKFKESEIVVYDTADNANLDLTGGRLDARMDDILVLQDQVVKPNGAGAAACSAKAPASACARKTSRCGLPSMRRSRRSAPTAPTRPSTTNTLISMSMAAKATNPTAARL